MAMSKTSIIPAWVLCLCLFPLARAVRDLDGAASRLGYTWERPNGGAQPADAHCENAHADLPPGVVCRPVPDPDLSVPPFISPYTAPDIPWDYQQQAEGETEPEQVSLFPATRNGSFVFVQFLVPRPSNASSAGTVPPPTVIYGRQPQALTATARLERSSSYQYGPYTSGNIHVTLLGPLSPSTNYFYKVGSLKTLFTFTSLPAPGEKNIHIALVGDVGQTLNSSETMRHVLNSPASLLLFAGDLTYADHYGPPCLEPHPDMAGVRRNLDQSGGTAWRASVSTASDSKKKLGDKICGLGGWRWDTWGRLMQEILAQKLTAFVAGNHELEFSPAWGELSPYKAYRARVPAMLDDSTWAKIPQENKKLPFGGFPALSPLFYSLDAGPVHVIGLSSYSPFLVYSHQWYWLQDDLCSIDRNVTPWVVVFMHVPWYNTNIGHYIEGEPMRLQLEEFLHESGVDLIVSGHVHAYERSFPVYNMVKSNDGCAAVHVTVGAGGNIEEVAGPFVEPQPSYSAYREESFGHAEFVVHGENNTLSYTWYRNKGGNAVASDSFEVTSRYHKCNVSTPSFCNGW